MLTLPPDPGPYAALHAGAMSASCQALGCVSRALHSPSGLEQKCLLMSLDAQHITAAFPTPH